MAVTRKVPSLWMHAGLGLWLISALALAASAAAQPAAPDAPKAHSSTRVQPQELSDRFPDKPSISASWTIPVDSLGYAAPGPLYLGERNSLASLDFIDENRLLFTFRVPALLHRQPGQTGETDERQIRAVVLALPGGEVQAEANWLLHDRARYLWMLHDGHFLLRDRNSVVEGDATLKLHPLLSFPGPVLSLALDPSQKFLVTNSREPTTPAAKSKPAVDTSSYTNSGGIDTTMTSGGNDPDLVLRILHRDSGQVMLVTRVRDLVHVPINSDGYLESLRGDGVNWTVDMNYFTGGSHPVGTVKSACMPGLSFVSESEVLATACADSGQQALVAMTTSGEKLWIDLVPDRQVWPVVVASPNGQRIARETLYVTHSINAFAPLGDDAIKGQWLQVFDAATGRVAFESPVSPILDAGGNVALSPSGRRVAVLNKGAIQVFELPAPPPLPDTAHLSR